MEEKSRVIKYADLRQKISHMDAYSFEETPLKTESTSKKNAHISPAKKRTDTAEGEGIKRNTLSFTIDELVKESETYNSANQKKETKKRFKAKQKGKRKPLLTFSGATVAWIIIAILILTLLVLLILIISGVL